MENFTNFTNGFMAHIPYLIANIIHIVKGWEFINHMLQILFMIAYLLMVVVSPVHCGIMKYLLGRLRWIAHYLI
jgi:hypothetical protein